MTIISEPSVTINLAPAAQDISNKPQKVLFIGQMISGTATTGELINNIGNSGEEDAIFGARSIIAQSIRQARKLNKVTNFDAIALEDNGTAVAASGDIAFSGTATADGTYIVSVGSKSNYSVTIAVASGDTAATVATALDNAYDLLVNAPITSAAVSGTVTFTAANGGTLGNKYGIKVEGVVQGLAFVVTGFASGANDPSLTGLFDVIEDERYQTIVFQSSFDPAVLTTELDSRFNVSDDVLDGVGIQQVTDTLSNVLIALAAQNSKSLSLPCNKLLDDATHKGGAMLEFDDVVTAKVAALRSLRANRRCQYITIHKHHQWYFGRFWRYRNCIFAIF